MRRLSAALLTILLAIGLCVPSVARAEIAWNDTGDRKSAIVSGYPYGDWGRCSALMEFLGFDWSTIGNDARNKLLTNSNGDNRFTQALQQTKNLQYDAQTIGNIDLSIFNIWGSIFGYSEMWGVSLPYQTYDDTVAYVRGVITGGDDSTGGGSGETEQGEYFYFSKLTPPSGDDYPSVTAVRVLKTQITTNEQFLADIQNGYVWLRPNNDKVNFSFVFIKSGGWSFRQSGTDIVFTLNAGTQSCPKQAQSTTAPNYGCNYEIQDGVMTVTLRNNMNIVSSSAWQTNQNASDLVYQGQTRWNGVLSDAPTPTPTPPQPDPPVTPPVTPTPPVYTPTPIGDPTITQPDYSEIIDWLEQLHIDLQAIEGQIVDTFNALDADLANWFQSLSDYIGETAEWMVDELEQYWDGLESNIIMWLKRIYSRLGGNGATKPDPTTDEGGFFEWLLALLQSILGFLLGDLSSTIGSLTSSLTNLTHLFPFSIPWDIMALFALFLHDPVTPVFDMPMPTSNLISGTGYQLVHVDCTQWDGTAAIVRSIILVVFAYGLLRRFPEWLGDFKIGGDD